MRLVLLTLLLAATARADELPDGSDCFDLGVGAECVTPNGSPGRCERVVTEWTTADGVKHRSVDMTCRSSVSQQQNRVLFWGAIGVCFLMACLGLATRPRPMLPS